MQHGQTALCLVNLDLTLRHERPLCTMAGAQDATRALSIPEDEQPWSFPQLTRLDLSGRVLHDDDMQSIAACSRLRDLNLSRAVDMIVLGASVRRLSQLTELTRLGASHCLTSYSPGLSGALLLCDA